MKIRDYGSACVVDVDTSTVSSVEIRDIISSLGKKASQKRIGLNLENVVELSHDFGCFLKEMAQKSRLSLFNMNNDTLLFLYITHYDKSVDIYMSEEDFCTDKHSFVNRRFRLLKTA